jgi:hypothetical protein
MQPPLRDNRNNDGSFNHNGGWDRPADFIFALAAHCYVDPPKKVQLDRAVGRRTGARKAARQPTATTTAVMDHFALHA